jgi:hypothetical protein
VASGCGFVTNTTVEVSFDVTNAVQQWYNNGSSTNSTNYGFVIIDQNEAAPVIGQEFVGQRVWEAYSLENPGSGEGLELKIYYSRPEYSVDVNATDPVLGEKPITGLNVTLDGMKNVTINGVASYLLLPDFDRPAGVVGGIVQSRRLQFLKRLTLAYPLTLGIRLVLRA